jgi:hypothetical protein
MDTANDYMLKSIKSYYLLFKYKEELHPYCFFKEKEKARFIHSFQIDIFRFLDLSLNSQKNNNWVIKYQKNTILIPFFYMEWIFNKEFSFARHRPFWTGSSITWVVKKSKGVGNVIKIFNNTGTLKRINILVIHFFNKKDQTGTFNFTESKLVKRNRLVLSNRFKFISHNIQLAGNRLGSSETIRHLSFNTDSRFNNWLAGIIDGDGYLDLKKGSIFNCTLKNPKVSCGLLGNTLNFSLKAIRIIVHNRDIRVLYRILNHFHFGRINHFKNKPYVMYIVSNREELFILVNLLNGLIRIKVDSFKKACNYLNITYKEANYILKPGDPYFAGLVDTEGSIIFNYSANRIECNLEFKYNDFSKKLNLDYVIPNYKPSVYFRKKKNQAPNIEFESIVFKFQTVKGMTFLYDYFIKNRLFSDFKFFRATKIKEFLDIRHFRNKPFNSLEFCTYSQFLLKFIKHLNTQYDKVKWLDKINIKR